MNLQELEAAVEAGWEARETIGLDTTGPVRDAVEAAMDALDGGKLRVAERRPQEQGGGWHVNQWAKKAVLLSFRLNDMALVEGGPGAMSTHWWDKVALEVRRAGARTGSATPAFAQCRTASCGAFRLHRARRRC